ncbi:lycopene cyclase domain-containing protein [Ferruginibacter sp. HRS2-29]|uniref:lycopene cyclase domain-containing protein n=1 Tax=Ferruginibacter sp. HRS2-29 TaxID=2487334 RepID=UPI0020CCF0DE|nr:lycopene cyclase domain-containing protein [Ferruginibacter sp. HRS2-29]MCP9749948.1 lycopene cyclase domain-containing protein [Ferruginibacter sp. HRS2-29]
MNAHYTYFLILILSLVGPFALSFDKKVAFYRQWRYLFPAMILPAAFFIIWDIIFTKQGVWSFNPGYITGIYLSAIPLEEALFFFVVPYCCVFIYECIRCYFPRLKSTFGSDMALAAVGAGLLVAAFFYSHRAYTFYTAIFNAVFIAFIFLFRRRLKFFNTAAFLVAYIIILLPFLAVNGVLTYLPVVIYNNAQNLGLRITTIPAEDIFYGMLLVLMNIVIFEKLRSRSAV